MKSKVIKIVIFSLLIMVIAYMSIGLYTFSIVSKYEDRLYPNMYINDIDISNISKEEVKVKINTLADSIETKKIKLIAGDKEFDFFLKDIGVSINKDELQNNILTYGNELSSFERMKKIINREKTTFTYKINFSKETLIQLVKSLSEKANTKLVQGKLVMGKDRVLRYEKGVNGFTLDVDKSVAEIEKNFERITTIDKITLIGQSVSPKADDLSVFNTKTSSFTTTYDTKIRRAKNVETAARYLDGTIVKPGETFSFYKYTGPFNKPGYVVYDRVLASGVCQVATTIYNTVLLGGLKVVMRYPHAYKMWYVAGGLDATVAATKYGPSPDFKFKNTYDYPIYISAYTSGGKLTIDFWSNDKAKGGKEYKTESVKINAKAYKTYLITYKDGKQVSRNLITTTYYPK